MDEYSFRRTSDEIAQREQIINLLVQISAQSENRHLTARGTQSVLTMILIMLLLIFAELVSPQWWHIFPWTGQ